MQKLFTSAFFVASFALSLSAQAPFSVYADSLYAEAPISEYEIDMPNYVINNTGGTVTMKWTRLLQQPFPGQWVTNFCDNNLCYLGQTSTAQFELMSGDTGLLKPVYYPNETAGTGIIRLKLESLTPGVDYVANLVYMAVVSDASGTVEVGSVRDLALFPNPAGDVLNVVLVDPGFRGTLSVTDATGRIVLTQNDALADTQLNVAALPAGLYLLQAWSQSDNVLITKAFSKR